MNFSEKSSQFVFQKKNSLEFCLGKSIEIFLEIFLDKKVLEFFIKKKFQNFLSKKKPKFFSKFISKNFQKLFSKLYWQTKVVEFCRKKSFSKVFFPNVIILNQKSCRGAFLGKDLSVWATGR
jgi:hypothetical protein